MKLTRTQIIIVLGVVVLILVGYWFLKPKNTPVISPLSPPNQSSFFPTNAIKNIVSTITNTITSTSTNEVSNEPFNNGVEKKDFDILRAHKVVATNTLDFLLASSSVIISPDSKQIISLKLTESGLVGELTNLKSKITTKVLTLPLTEWLITWPTLNTLNLQTRPASGVDGFAYNFNLTTKQLVKTLGPVVGLNSLLNPEGTKVIYSSSQNGQIKTYLKIIGKDINNELGLKTLVDKCLWRDKNYVICAVTTNYPAANYPDAWYQGLTSFTDDIWLINTDKLESYLISIFGQPLADEPIDAVNLKISPDKKTLYFINKRDQSLWSFDLAHAF